VYRSVTPEIGQVGEHVRLRPSEGEAFCAIGSLVAFWAKGRWCCAASWSPAPRRVRPSGPCSRGRSPRPPPLIFRPSGFPRGRAGRSPALFTALSPPDRSARMCKL